MRDGNRHSAPSVPLSSGDMTRQSFLRWPFAVPFLIRQRCTRRDRLSRWTRLELLIYSQDSTVRPGEVQMTDAGRACADCAHKQRNTAIQPGLACHSL
jgi:hypothetical protein